VIALYVYLLDLLSDTSSHYFQGRLLSVK